VTRVNSGDRPHPSPYAGRSAASLTPERAARRCSSARDYAELADADIIIEAVFGTSR
jgi:3-hydroxyacyl-CoA dehydrogenase